MCKKLVAICCAGLTLLTSCNSELPEVSVSKEDSGLKTPAEIAAEYEPTPIDEVLTQNQPLTDEDVENSFGLNKDLLDKITVNRVYALSLDGDEAIYLQAAAGNDYLCTAFKYLRDNYTDYVLMDSYVVVDGYAVDFISGGNVFTIVAAILEGSEDIDSMTLYLYRA